MKKSVINIIKIFIAVVLIFSFILTAAIFYLNNVFLPTKIKALVIKGLEDKTGKDVSLGSVKINIFKGLVLSNLIVSDESAVLLKVKEASCIFLPLPFLKKKIIVPLVSLESPEILIVRNKDNVFNFQEFIFPETSPAGKELQFDLLVSRININKGKIMFRDESLPVVFQKSLENINLSVYLSLPSNVKFSVTAEIPSVLEDKLKIIGDFKVAENRLLAKVWLTGLKPKELDVYFQQFGFDVSSGLVNTTVALDLRLKENILNADFVGDIKGLAIKKDGLTFNFNCQPKALISCNFKDKNISYSGEMDIVNSSVSGVETVGNVDALNGKIVFNNSGASCEGFLASIWEIPFTVKAKLVDFNNPYLDLNVYSALDLSNLQKVLTQRLKLNFPLVVNGKGRILVNISTKLPVQGDFPLKWSLIISQAEVRINKVKDPLEHISGQIDFNLNNAEWQDLHFNYAGVLYKSMGKVINFKSPLVELGLASSNLKLDSRFSINNKLINLDNLSGKYFDSNFSAAGTINIEDAAKPEIDVNGGLDVNLVNIKEVAKKFQPQLEKLKPQGRVLGQFSFQGNPQDWKNCFINAQLTSDTVSCAGFSASGLVLNYNQSGGIINVPAFHFVLYDGTFDASGSVNLNSQSTPYWLDTNLVGLKIEKLKLDTPLKDKDISGIIQFSSKLSGVFDNLAMVNGSGKISIKEGKLWQLDLFQGIGSLLFVKDFANIVFNEGNCAFVVKDRYVSTENLILRSNIANLFGPVKIGFDSSINAQLSVEVLSQMVPLTGTYRDVATAILGQAEKFAVIEISETLQKPKIKFKTAYFDIFKGLADTLLKSIPH